MFQRHLVGAPDFMPTKDEWDNVERDGRPTGRLLLPGQSFFEVMDDDQWQTYIWCMHILEGRAQFHNGRQHAPITEPDDPEPEPTPDWPPRRQRFEDPDKMREYLSEHPEAEAEICCNSTFHRGFMSVLRSTRAQPSASSQLPLDADVD